MKTEIKISGMSCMHCVNAVTKALENLTGVTKVKVDLKKEIAVIETKENLPDDVIKTAISEAGYEVNEIKKI